MKAILYDMHIVTDIAHGWTDIIKEVCVKDLGLFVNEESAFLLSTHSEIDFRLASAQNKQEIEIDAELVERMLLTNAEFNRAYKNLVKRGRNKGKRQLRKSTIYNCKIIQTAHLLFAEHIDKFIEYRHKPVEKLPVLIGSL